MDGETIWKEVGRRKIYCSGFEGIYKHEAMYGKNSTRFFFISAIDLLKHI